VENIIELKTINELCQYSFLIPSYQRGYRWTNQEVEDLLNDINEFKPRQIEDTDDKTWYCLQPIVSKQSNSQQYEVIDGQQRLTTVYLVLFYLNQDFIEARRDKIFDLDYETRKNTKQFLDDIERLEGYTEDNIDFYYISCAYETIGKWFASKGNNFNKDDFRSKFKFNTKIIWYECFEDDTISVFTRLNIGKISLTNAELIKALFLNSSNYDIKESKKLREKQFEISTEWDSIENALQNDKLWYFITGNMVSNNRIEFIFNLMNKDYNPNDNYSTFRYFSKIVSSKSQENIEENWREIKQYFQRFNEWFNDRILYHKIGYLICIGAANIDDLFVKSSEMTKSNFKEYLDYLIKDNLKSACFSNLQYGDKYVKRVLLLYNILTMLKNEQDSSYFPFDLYKKENWDIEHITSVKESIPESESNRLDWLGDVKPYIDDTRKEAKSLQRRIDNCTVSDDQEFIKLFEDIVSHFNRDINDDEINGISNLTLLDSKTNRSYKNAVFPVKRKTIIERDKSGVFIPICTKNVFLKYFSEYPPKISFWTQDDRDKYEIDLRTILENYLGGI